MFKTASPIQDDLKFENVLTGAVVEPADWQLALSPGDHYKIEQPFAGIIRADGSKELFSPIVPVYGQIVEPISPGYFWVRAYSQWCPEGELGAFCIAEASQPLTPEQFEQAREEGWP